MTKNSKRDSLTVSFAKGEDPEQLIRRFTKKVRNSGLVQDLLQRRFYEKPSIKRKKKHIRAIHSLRSEDLESEKED